MSELTRITAPDGVFPAARYSRVVLGTGGFVAVSGRPAVDEGGRPVGAGDPAAPPVVRSVRARGGHHALHLGVDGERLAHGRRAVTGGESVGDRLGLVRSSRTCVGAWQPRARAFDYAVEGPCSGTDMVHMPPIRAAQAAHIPDDRPSAASAVQVGALAGPGFLTEVEALAVVAE